MICSKRAQETTEQRIRHQVNGTAYRRKPKAAETPEGRKHRLTKDSAHQRAKRVVGTPEQRKKCQATEEVKSKARGQDTGLRVSDELDRRTLFSIKIGEKERSYD